MAEHKNKCLNTFSSKFGSFITYSTDRSASIKSFKVGFVYRIAQILILTYIFGWELYHNKGYQIFDSVSSVVTTKVKGQGFIPLNSSIDFDLKEQNSTFLNELYKLKSDLDYRMMDTADYVIPPNEYNSIFIMTNFLKTKQHQDKCPEVNFNLLLLKEFFRSD